MLKNLFSRPASYLFEVAICAIVKDEEYLPEWIDYHQTIGVSQFYIYDNESAKPVSKILQKYIESGLVKVELITGKVQQMIAYGDCLKRFGALCKWIAFIDADEFIVPKIFTGSLPEFMEAYEPYGGLGINWLIFGSNGHKEKQASQIEGFTRRSLKSNLTNNHIKSIVQPKYVKHIPSGPHHFHYLPGKYAVNENFKRIKGAHSAHSTRKIQLNHYWLRSETDFKEKLIRGRADQNSPQLSRKMDDFYQTDAEANFVVDETIITLRQIMKKESSI